MSLIDIFHMEDEKSLQLVSTALYVRVRGLSGPTSLRHSPQLRGFHLPASRCR